MSGGSRGSASIGLAVAVAAVAGGMALGTGVAKHTVKSDYDLVWLGDAARGQVVQVDPSANRANLRLQVAPAGHPLSVQQTDGQLVIVDKTTGKTTSVDLSTLLVGGSRIDPDSSAVKVLVDGSHMYLADLTTGTVQAVDPATERNIGAPWSAGHPLVDVAIDGQHTMWALGDDDSLTSLSWSDKNHELSTTGAHKIKGTGAGSVVVGHDKGVTVVGSRGIITRVGDGADRSMSGPTVQGGLSASQSSPDDLLSVSAPGNSAVVIVDQQRCAVDDVGVLGCAHPGAPVVFDGDIYVPCLGADRVLVLDRNGRPAAAALQTPPGGDPQLVVGGDRLLISVPGAAYTTVVDAGGTASRIQVIDPTIGVEQPSDPSPPPPPAPHPSDPHHGDDGDHHDGGSHTGDGSQHPGYPGEPSGSSGSSGAPSSGSGSSSGASGAPGSGASSGSGASGGSSSGSGSSGSSAPTSGGSVGSGQATAVPQSDGTVIVSWKSSEDAGASYVVRIAGGDKVATAPAGSTSATVTVLAPGTTAQFEVDAVVKGQSTPVWTALTAAVTSYTAPGAVTGVSVGTSTDGTTATITATWTPAAANGRDVTYTVSADGATSVTTADTTATLSVACSAGCSGTVTVTPNNEVGAGTSGTAAFSSSAPAPAPVYPAAGETYASVAGTADGYDNGDGTSAEGSVTLTLTAPSDWAASVGTTCTLFADGVSQGVVPCNDSGVAQTFYYGDYGTVSHTYYVDAAWSGGSADSASVTASVTVPVPVDPGTGTGTAPCTDSVGQAQSLTGEQALALPACDPTSAPCPGCAIPYSTHERALTGADAVPTPVSFFREPR